MRQFACKVRLSGSLYNEVPKSDVTVPEIIILRTIHGGEAVADIVEIDAVKRTDAEERDRLAHTYGAAIKNRPEIIGGLPALVGFSGTALPVDAPGVPAAGKPAKKPSKGKPVEDEIVEDDETDQADENPEE